MIIKADLHTHTLKSFDGRQNLTQLVAAAKARGLQAVAITDHDSFSDLPEFMDGILLIPGCEFSTAAGHITGLFLQEAPALHKMSGSEAIEEIHRRGGIAVLAHPFQKPSRREEEFDFTPDSLETANARAAYKNEAANTQAIAYAEKKGLPTIGGSDAHSPGEVGNAYTEFQCESLSRESLKQAILAGNCKAILQKNTPRRMIGLSQLARRRRMGGLKNLLIGLLYLCKCILKDLF